MEVTRIDDQPALQALGSAGRVGLLALSTDINVEAELHRMLPEGVLLVTTRIANPDDITHETLRGMEAALIPAASSLAPNSPLDILVYGCTSGTIALGERQVEDLLLRVKPMARCVTPSSAVGAGLQSLGAKRISVLAPYSNALTGMIADSFKSKGFQITSAHCFDLTTDSQMAAVSRAAWIDAARKCYDHSADALFISCTSVQASAAIDEIETEINAPVICSNQALAWLIGNHLGVMPDVAIQGRLAGIKHAT